MMLVFICTAFSVSADIRKVRSRQLTDETRIELEPYADILNIDTLLGNKILSVDIVNDSVPTDIRVFFSVSISDDNDLTSTDWEGHVSMGFLKSLEGGESFHVDNTMVVEILSNPESYIEGFTDDPENTFVGEFGPGGASKYPGSLDMESLDPSDITGMINDLISEIPEGIFEIAFAVYDLSVSSSTPKSSVSAPIIITQKGDISIDETPEIGSPLVSWNLPEIPDYNDSSHNTKSIISIDIIDPATGKDFTDTVIHTQPAGSGYKGYPGGTDEGLYTYDLTAKNLPFRAGETYYFTVEFLDWNSGPVTDAKTLDFSFDTPDPESYSPTAGATGVNLQSISFEWGLDQYSEWIDSYDLYLDDQLIASNISDTTYEYSGELDVATQYSWYVIPYYASDGAAFYTTPPVKWNFTTMVQDPPEFTISDAQASDILLAGESYTFSVDPVIANDASVESIQWKIDGRVYSGSEVTYTPARRYLNDSLTVSCTVTDSYGASAQKSIALTVWQVESSISGSSDAFANRESAYSISAGDAQNAILTVTAPDGEETTYDGENVNLLFDQLGTYTLEAVTSAEDYLGNTKEVVSREKEVSVESLGDPELSITSPAASSVFSAEDTVSFSAAIESPNTIVSTVWSVNGQETAYDGEQEQFSFDYDLAAGSSATIEVLCRVTDEFGAQTSLVRDISVVNPTISFASITDGAVLSMGQTLPISITADFASQIIWSVDGDDQYASRYTFSEDKTYTLTAEAFWTVTDPNGGEKAVMRETSLTVVVEDREPPEVTIADGASAYPLLAGYQYSFTAVADADATEIWWTVDNTRVSTGDALRYSFDTAGVADITVHAKNAYGVEGTDTLSMTVVSPTLFVQEPSSAMYPEDSAVPIYGAVSSGSLLWKVEQDSSEDIFENGRWARKFDQAGIYTIIPGYRITAAGSAGTEQTFEVFDPNKSFDLEIYSTAPPAIVSRSPERELLQQTTDTAVDFSVSATSMNGDVSYAWTISPDEGTGQTGSNSSFSPSWAAAGLYTVTAEITDPRGLSETEQWTVRIIDPQLQIQSPQEGSVWGSGSLASPEVFSSDVGEILIAIDGKEPVLLSGTDLSGLPVGNHTIQASSEYSIQPADGSMASQTIMSQLYSYTIVSKDPPTITVSGISPGDRILAGREYPLAATAFGSQNAAIASISWYVDGERTTEAESFTLEADAAVSAKTITVTAVDEFGLSASKELSVSVVDPEISVVLPRYSGVEGVFPVGQTYEPQYSGRDVDTVVWVINGSEQRGHSFALSEGRYTISVIGTVDVREPDSAGSAPYEIRSQEQELLVYDAPVIFSIEAGPSPLMSGDALIASVERSVHSAVLSSERWMLDGVLVGAGVRAEIADMQTGTHTLQYVVTDLFGRNASSTQSVTVYDDIELAIVEPAAGAMFAPDDRILLTGVISDPRSKDLITSYTWEVDGKEISDADALSAVVTNLEEGDHRAVLELGLVDGSTKRASQEFSVQGDLLLSLQDADDEIVLLEGSRRTFRVSARALSSNVSVNSIAQDITWYVDGQSSGKGISYSFEEGIPDDYELYAEYSGGGITRTTDTITVSVIAVPDAQILSPASGTSINYTSDTRVSLSGSGYSDANYSWYLDGKRIGVGRNVDFDPVGYNGSYRLELLTEYGTLARSVSQMLTLKPNTPPDVTITTDAMHLVGSTLSWQSSSIDVEDGALASRILLDGQYIAPEAVIEFTDDDIGQHQLRISAQDSRGITASASAVFTVEPEPAKIQVMNPAAGIVAVENKMIQLTAAAQRTTDPDDYIWSVEYLDQTSGKAVLNGNNIMYELAGTGQVLLRARYTDPRTGQSSEAQSVISVEQEPVEISLYWPYGDMVTAGKALSPELIGEIKANYTASWFIDGRKSSLSDLSAPGAAGEHTLAVEISDGQGSIFRDQLSFMVNERPVPMITSPMNGANISSSSVLILSGAASDDQAAGLRYLWSSSDGSVLGEQQSLILEDIGIGDHTVTLTVRDSYGAESAVDTSFTVYDPVQIASLKVNNGVSTYLMNETGAGIPVEAVLAGGADAKVSWTMKMNGNEYTAEGSSAVLQPVQTGNAVITCTVSDLGTQQFQKQISVNVVDSAALALVSPAQGASLRAEIDQQVVVHAAGFSGPKFTVQLNGKLATFEETSSDGELHTLKLSSVIFRDEGIYELKIIASEGRMNREAMYTMNIFEMEPGILLSGIPEVLDLTAAGTVVTAEPVLIEPSRLLWYTSASTEVVAQGPEVELNGLPFAAGPQTLTVEALDENGMVLAQSSAELMVLGAMQLVIAPAGEQMTLRQGAGMVFSAEAYDRDGSVIAPEAVTWTSLELGKLAQGYEFIPGTAGLAIGEHMIIVQADGSLGDRKETAVQLLIRDSGGGTEEIAEEPAEPVEQKKREFSRGRMISSSKSNANVSTVIMVSGGVTVNGGEVDLRTAFRADDRITIEAGGSLLLVNTRTASQQNLNTAGDYSWNSVTSTWQ